MIIFDKAKMLSNMATASRVSLFSDTIEAFLRKLNKSHKKEWGSLRQGLRIRYLSEDPSKADSAYNFFGNVKPSEWGETLKAVGQDIHELLTMFEGNKAVRSMKSFVLLQKLFDEQCSLEPTNAQESGKAAVVRIKDLK
jgi:hypothetical protein